MSQDNPQGLSEADQRELERLCNDSINRHFGTVYVPAGLVAGADGVTMSLLRARSWFRFEMPDGHVHVLVIG